MFNVIEYNQERTSNVCYAIKGLNAKESRFVFVDYITQDERDIINGIKAEARYKDRSDDSYLKGKVKDISEHSFIKQLNIQLKTDIASCLKIDQSRLKVDHGGGSSSTNDGGLYSMYYINNTCCHSSDYNPSFEEALAASYMHIDNEGYFKIDGEGERCCGSKLSLDTQGLCGFKASLAIVGPSTTFAEYNEYLYPGWNSFNHTSITKIVQPEENQVALFTIGESGAAHGYAFPNFDMRIISFVSADDGSTNRLMSDFILGDTFFQDNLEL